MPADPTPSFPGYAALERLDDRPWPVRKHVYRARRITDGQSVILKMSADPTMAEESLARLRHERDMLAQVSSERVIRVVELAVVDSVAALVLTDSGGESLDCHLARGRFALVDTLAVAMEVVAALRDVHAARVIHRDVAPSNIVYCATTGAVRLIDFDAATAWRTDRHGLAPGALEGTLQYMAPEQTGRMNRATDSRADLYAFGVTLFELLTGRLPFVETDPLKLVHAHVAVRPPAPDAIDPAIPRPLSAIVMKLLAKAPEDRYQTAEGVLADLEVCADQLRRSGAIGYFTLGRDDVITQLELPDKLYGRAAEIAVLSNAFGRVTCGSVETILVSGHSGVGKSSVVRELFPMVTRARGYFVSGKFDQLRREAPYSALVAAFDELVHHLLTEAEDDLARWRHQINEAIAPNGQVVVEAIPALGKIVGPQPPILVLDAAATQLRFHLTLQRLLQVFTRRAHPLVLFLDDMQWADPESIQLLKLVAMSDLTESLLLIHAFRDSEVSDGHPLMAAMRDLERDGTVTRLALAPLPTSEITALVADCLHRDVASVEPLARLVCRKTDGNPFFVRQLLCALRDAGHIAFDPELRGFTFDAASIECAPISANVADLLADRLSKLPPATLRLLALAAAIGNRFELDMLAGIAEESPFAVHAALASALDHELVVPLSELEFIAARDGAGLAFRRLRFQHDRIQRAAYAVMSSEEQQRLHLRIGELVLARTPPGELPDRIFDVVSHWNRAIHLIEAPERIAQLARLDIMAARKARGSAAYAVAIDCLQLAVDRLDWQADYRELLDAQLMLAECCYLAGEVVRALGALDVAAEHAADNRDRGAVEAQRATLHIYGNDLASAIRCTRRAASLVGYALPDDRDALRAGVRETIAQILARIGERPVEDLVDLPVMTDRDVLALMALFNNSMPAAFQREPSLGAFITARMVLLSLEHGNCATSAHAYCAFTRVLLDSDHRLALRFGQLGVALNRRLNDRAGRPTVDFVFALFAQPWISPISDAIASMHDAAQIGRETGDPIHAGYGAAHEISYRVFRGSEPLDDLVRDARIYRQQCGEVGDVPSARYLGWQIDRLQVFLGEIDWLSAADASAALGRFADLAEVNPAHQFNGLALLVESAYALGDSGAALEVATGARALERGAPNLLAVAEHRFYHCLAALAQPAARDDLSPIIDANLRDLRRAAAICPVNFEARALLVEAAQAARTSELTVAMECYDRAIASATRHGARWLEALASELAGRFWIDRGKPDFALGYLARARSTYAALGARGKVRMLERKHPGITQVGPPRLQGSISGGTSTEVLDVTAIAKATRAISGELELDKLLGRMLVIIFEQAGADGGALVLDTPRGLAVAASRTAGASEISTASVALADAALPRALVHYVHRTGTTVVLDEAASDTRFGNDDYIRKRAPKAALSMPVKHQDRAMGVLYLENTLVSRAFTPARLDALTILVSQLAVSLDNAALFAAQRVQADAILRANDELRAEITVREQAERELARYRSHLEDLIAERTQALTLANQKLREAAAEHDRIEGELRLAQKLEAVGRLAAGIAHEINTPIQFASDHVTFVRDVVPGLLEPLARYRELAAAAAAHPELAALAAAARAAEEDSDLDYALSRAPEALSSALVGLGRVAAIVRSMKAFAHDRNEKVLVDLNQAIENTVVIAANECKYVASVHTDLAPLPLVCCNGGEINQAVLNLIINAAHAIRDVVGQSGAKGEIEIRTRTDGHEVEIQIRDTGTGIPPEIRHKIYDPFFTTKEVGRGTGQGLAIVRNVIVDKHGGSLRFETELGVGTTFFLRLPIGDASSPNGSLSAA